MKYKTGGGMTAAGVSFPMVTVQMVRTRAVGGLSI